MAPVATLISTPNDPRADSPDPSIRVFNVALVDAVTSCIASPVTSRFTRTTTSVVSFR